MAAELLKLALAGSLMGSPAPLAGTDQGEEVVIGLPPRAAVAYHEVAPGESLALLAHWYDVETDLIASANGATIESLTPGMELKIPIITADPGPRLPPGIYEHIVQPGESLDAIRSRYNLSLLELVSANPGLGSLDRIQAGARLFIPLETRGILVALGPGEILPMLAQRFAVSLNELAQANDIVNPLELEAGDLVLIPEVLAPQAMARLELQRRRELEEAAQAERAAEERRQAEFRRVAEERRIALAKQRAEEAARATQAQVQQVSVQTKSSYGFQRPVNSYRITSYYGRRSLWVGGTNFHTGTDFAAPTGTPIFAAKAGRVVTAGWSRVGYGIHAMLDHGQGVQTLYGHMSKLIVRSGQDIKQGQIIGYVGSTGFSTGPHLHFEVRIGGQTKDPLAYLP